MHDPARVREGHGVAYPQEDAKQLTSARTRGVLVESLALDQPHDVVGAAVGQRAIDGPGWLAGQPKYVWATLAGRVRTEKPMTETPYNAAADRPLTPVPAE